MKTKSNHKIELSSINEFCYQIIEGRLVLFFQDTNNHLTISFPIQDGQLFVTLGSMRADVAEEMTNCLEMETINDEPLIILSGYLSKNEFN